MSWFLKTAAAGPPASAKLRGNTIRDSTSWPNYSRKHAVAHGMSVEIAHQIFNLKNRASPSLASLEHAFCESNQQR